MSSMPGCWDVWVVFSWRKSSSLNAPPWHEQEMCFRLKNGGTYGNVSGLTTKHHDEERLKVLMTLGRQRKTKGHGDSVSAASESRTPVVNAVLRSVH